MRKNKSSCNKLEQDDNWNIYRIYRLALLISGLISLFISLFIPTDPKNAWLWGYSLERVLMIITISFYIFCISTYSIWVNTFAFLRKIKKTFQANMNLFGRLPNIILSISSMLTFYGLYYSIKMLDHSIINPFAQRLFPIILLTVTIGLVFYHYTFSLISKSVKRNSIFAALLMGIAVVRWWITNPTDTLHNYGLPLIIQLGVIALFFYFVNVWIVQGFGSILKNINVILSLSFVISFIFIALSRINYNFALEWIEGGYIQIITRLLEGQKIYVAPSLSFIPIGYTPLFPYLAALLSKIIGISFFPLRLISIISTIGSLLIIFLIIYRGSQNFYTSTIGSCLYLATYPLTGGWFDVGRVDSLFLFFLLLTIYFIKINKPFYLILAGLSLILAFLTKQTALIIYIPFIIGSIIVNKRNSLIFIITTLTFSIISILALNYFHNGWFNYFAFTLPSTHSFGTVNLLIEKSWRFVSMDLLGSLALAIFLILSSFLLHPWKQQKLTVLSISLPFAIGLTGLSLGNKLDLGAYKNGLLPVYSTVAIYFGYSINIMGEYLKTFHGNKKYVVFKVILHLAITLQLVSLFYSVSPHLPSKRQIKSDESLLQFIINVKGSVFIPSNNYLPLIAGKETYFLEVGFNEFSGNYGKGNPEMKKIIVNEFIEALDNREFDAILFDKNSLENYVSQEHYLQIRIEDCLGDLFSAVTGSSAEPVTLFILDSYESEINHLCPNLK